MGLSVPDLDEKTFDELVNEARALIARYAPEWTDHNVHDPGITFIELFAWLAEMQIYQLDQVTDENYRKFLELVGLYPFDAKPARVDISFKNVTDEKPTIEAGTQVITDVGAERIVFETEEDFTLIPVSLESVKTTYDSKTIDNTLANEKEGVYFAAFGEKAPVGAELRLGFDKALSDKEIHITFDLFDEDLLTVGNHIDEPAQVYPSASVVWEYWNGEKWNELTPKKDTTLALTRSGRIVFNKKDDLYLFNFEGDLNTGIISEDLKKKFETEKVPLSENAMVKKEKEDKWVITDGEKIYIVRKEDGKLNIYDGFYRIRCRLKEGRYEIVPQINRILLNTVSTFQIETIIGEYLGTGLGIPEQKVQLKKKPVINRITFSVEDILDWLGLLQKLKEQGCSREPNPGKRICDIFDPEIQTLIKKWKVDREPDNALKYAIVESLNKVLERRDLYEFDSFKNIKTADAPRKLLMYLFCWDEIQGNDDVRLIEFLIKNYDVNWVRITNIKKSDDGKTITISNGKNSLSLRLDNEEKKLKITLSDGRTDEFNVKIEDDKQNIYILARRLEFTSDAEARSSNRFLIEAAYPDEIAKHSLIIQLQRENGEWENWNEVDDFESSGPDDPHYMFDPEEGEITFGNGLNGRIPLESQKIRASYKTTLGTKGNTPEGQKWWINNEGFKGIKGKNQKAATGGKDAEPIEHAKARARKDFREHYRAITSEDYEQLALSTPGLSVARAKAIPNYNPDYPCIAIPGTVTVVVVPYTRAGTVTPVPGKCFILTILNHLEKHRLVTTDVHAIGSEYVKVSVKCKVQVNKRSSPTEVKKRVTKSLKCFLDPLKGGPERNGWPFGRSVFPSEIYQIIDKVEGVDYATGISITAEGYQKEGGGDTIKIPPIALVFSGDHEVGIIGEKEVVEKNECTRIQDTDF
ncbi:Baseplate J-like protein [Candidatus Methanophagaceae archaeon]|nr:Baseplate J-like protein [Methanophagales archaeon]